MQDKHDEQLDFRSTKTLRWKSEWLNINIQLCSFVNAMSLFVVPTQEWIEHKVGLVYCLPSVLWRRIYICESVDHATINGELQGAQREEMLWPVKLELWRKQGGITAEFFLPKIHTDTFA